MVHTFMQMNVVSCIQNTFAVNSIGFSIGCIVLDLTMGCLLGWGLGRGKKFFQGIRNVP